MLDVNGSLRKNPAVILNSICMERNVKRVTVSVKKSVAFCSILAKTITTIQTEQPLNNDVCAQTMLMARHQKIAKLFDEDFWGTQ